MVLAITVLHDLTQIEHLYCEMRIAEVADFFEVTLDELVGRKEDIALLEGFIKRFVPANAIPVGDNDALTTICRFFDFLDKHGFSADDKVSAMKKVFVEGNE